MVIKKLKERIKSLSGNMKEDKIKKELEDIETISIELDHRVKKLTAENEHLKQTYMQLYDSIKSSRIRSKEQCDDLINQVNLKSTENSDLNASLQEKNLVITALKENLRKLKGKVVVNEVVISHLIDPEIGIFINQSKYALESLKKYGFESCELVDTPIVEKSKLNEDKEGKVVDPSHYRVMIDTLLYLTASRPDLQFAIYMCSCVNRGLWYPKDSLIALTTFLDADHAGCQDARRSTSEKELSF
nr:hypothetical protein [Tanacetum cinerariifolium]